MSFSSIFPLFIILNTESIAMRPNMVSVVSAFFFFELLSFATINISFCNGSTYVGCIQSEREALLRFKQDLTDPFNRLVSWIDDGDCCKWAGVVCDNFTGHVFQLNLRNPHLEYFTSGYFSEAESEAYSRSTLGGTINPSLLDLKNLIHLDLSYNDFEGIQLPAFLGSMENLRYLNLSRAGFRGMIPQQLGNLSNLQYFDLQHNSDSYELYVENSAWISSLTLLKHLDLSGVNLSKTSDQWLLKISLLPFLEILRLSRCQLQHSPQISIANFSSLTTLDLSSNTFDKSFIPNWIFGLNHLVFLDLSWNNFQGPIFNGLQNLTSLKHLDLTYNNFNSSIPNWLSRISHLEFLSLRGNYLHGSISRSNLCNLTSLKYLDLSSNHFNSSIPSWLSKISHLEYLSLSHNDLQGSISSSLGNLTSIRSLDLSFNRLQGRIPTSFERLCNMRSISLSFLNLNSNISEVLDIFLGCVSTRLESLYLNDCQLSGHLTDQLGRFKNLETLDLFNNAIYGPIPSSLWELLSLQRLDLSYNKLNETISQIEFNNLTRLVELSLAENSRIVVKVNCEWVPPFQLRTLNLRSCHVGPHFPLWLHSQKSLYDLDISNNGISDVIPDWFWKSLSQFFELNISHNQIHQKIPNLASSGGIEVLDLSSNKFFGPLPQISFDVAELLDLSSNAFSGSILPFLCYGVNKSRDTSFLNLENNSLFGELPDCGWMNWQNLEVLNLGNNTFTGTLPTSIGNLTYLNSLIIRKNNFSGVIPVEALQNCTFLLVLDASENRFVENPLKWIGERFSYMRILNFRSNNLHGFLPTELCNLSSLHILDLADNHLSGNIPSCIDNFSAMVTVDPFDSNDIFYMSGRTINFGEHALLVRKGIAYEYSTILNLVRAIDLSNNDFSGDIPREITSLKALWWLNLSHNSLIGRIPETIGAMGEIDSIDFSANQLCGEIPQSISNLTFLSSLNLSNNKLTGRIPSGTQLQGFDPSCFTGNDLYGCPLPKDCNVSVQTPSHQSGRGKDGNKHEVDWFYKHEVDWFYMSLVLGFVVGFWGFVGPLLINRRWRCIYCGFLDSLGDKIHLIVKKC